MVGKGKVCKTSLLKLNAFLEKKVQLNFSVTEFLDS